MATLDAWGELEELRELLDEFEETRPGEYFGVDAMRASLEQRRAALVDEILGQQHPVPERLDIILDGAGTTSRGVRISVLADLLREVQETLAAIGTAIARGPRHFRVSAQMRDLVAMRVSVALPGSLAVRLVPADESLTRTTEDLFGEYASLLEQSADRLVEFFANLPADDESVLDAVSTMGPRGAARVRELARLIADSQMDTRMRWRSPRSTRDALIDVETARRLQEFLATLEESEYPISYQGRLMGGSLLRRRFELVLPDDQVISGSVEEAIVPLLATYFGRPCRAEVIVAIVSTPGGLTRESRTLVGLSPSES